MLATLGPSVHRVQIVGNPLGFHMGGYLRSASESLSLPTHVSDTRRAAGKGIWQRICWHLLDHSYANQRQFEQEVLRTAATFNPTLLLALGICPLRARTLRELKSNRVRCVNFLTDDPFNPHHRCRWFLNSLGDYTTVYSPRRSNMAELEALGCRDVRFLPFGYDPKSHFPFEGERPTPQFDVLFVGGADGDRVPYVQSLAQAGLKVVVYGGYWDQFAVKNVHVGGVASPEQLRRASVESRLSMILVRRANRDGHVMRSWEAAAFRSCLLVEDTAEHREIFGDDNVAVRYFSQPGDLVQRARDLLADEAQRERLADAVWQRIVRSGTHTYQERLKEILAHSAKPEEHRA